ncbi:hypothetical protein [Clostridium cochlearium]|uniref:hypothetical protein n=1 Tax=Clostridium cochlearium TaxID=1494 RepID=UPI001C0F1655|nr:hypothetical protein [Clostridium cochlearium]MBU5270281.1 hypothetical protein [Clostridium cochlearium]
MMKRKMIISGLIVSILSVPVLVSAQSVNSNTNGNKTFGQSQGRGLGKGRNGGQGKGQGRKVERLNSYNK